MANTFKLKRSSVQGRVPTTSDLSAGELAWNSYDGKLFGLKDDGTAAVVEIGASGSSSNFSGATSSTAGAAGLVPAPSAGDQAKYLQADGTWSVPTDTNTTYSNATTSVSGLMSSTDKSKLDGIQSSAKNFSVGVGSGTASTANGNGYLSASNTNYANTSVGTVTFHPPDLSAYLRSNATDTASGLISFTHDDGIWIKPGTNGTGAQIRFSDQSSGSYAQYGTIEYLHQDGAVTTTGGNSNDGFVIKGTETRTVVKVEGDVIATGTIYDGTARVLTTADEGSGNGIDADTVDGQQGSYYLDYNNFTNTPTIPSSSSFIDTSNTNQTKAGRLTLGSTSATNEGLSLLHSASTSGYAAIRGYDGSTSSNNSTIHFFSNSWTSSGTTSGVTGSQGCINLSGSYGVTIGPWNNPHAYVENNILAVRGDGTATRGSLKLFRDTNAKAVSIAPSNSTTNYTLTLPTNGGTNNYYLKTDGNGNLSWGNDIAYCDNADAMRAYVTTGNTIYLSGPSTTSTGYHTHYCNAGLYYDSTNSQLNTAGAVIGGNTYPTVTGSSGQVLTTNGSGTLSWTTVSGGSSGIANVVDDTTPQLGGNLDTNGKNIVLGDSAGTTDDRITFGASADLQIYHSGNDSFVLDQGTGGLILGGSNVSIRDSTGSTRYMQFGSANINIDGDGTNTASLHLKSETNGSKVLIKAPTNANFSTSVWYLTLPGGPGSNGQVLTTDGTGNTSWTTVSSGGGGIASVAADTTPELGGSLDMGGLNIYSDGSGLGGNYGDMGLQPIATNYGSQIDGGLKIHTQLYASGTYVTYYFDGPDLSTPGSITATGNVTAYSDIKLKKEIKPIKNALDKVCKINGVTFERTDLETKSRFAGVIAQEIEQVLPEVVSTDEQGLKSVAYGNLVGLLVEAIKEQQTQIDGLRKAIEER